MSDRHQPPDFLPAAGSPPGADSLRAGQQIDAVCDQFEDAWQRGAPLPIAALVDSADPSCRAALLKELILLELHYRRSQGEQPSSSDYAERFPTERELISELFASSGEAGGAHQATLEPAAGSPPLAAPDASTKRGPAATAPDTLARSTANPTPQAPGSSDVPQLEGYQLLAPLGQGGMGTVWRAIQLSTKREVALKLMSDAAFASDQAHARFAREVELSARLQHPNVAQVYDSGRQGPLVYYALQLIPGKTLDKFVSGGGLAPRDVIRLMVKVCRGVHHAHQHGVIHRDLKPANILVSDDGNPFVLDFGLAKEVMAEESAGGSDLTREGAIAGTPAYMAPEQAAGQIQRVDTRTDGYALGVILYRLLTGESPHELRGSTFDVLSRIIHEEPRRPRDLPDNRGRGIDRDLEAILLKCLEKEPQQRYRSVEEFADDLQRYLDRRPVRARPVSTLGRFTRWVARHRVVASLLGTLICLVIGGLVAAVNAAWIYREMAREQSELRVTAEVAELETRENLYIAQMNLAGKAAERPSGAQRAREILLNWLPEHAAAESPEDAAAEPEPGSQNSLQQSRQPAAEADLRGWEWYLLAAQNITETGTTPTFNLGGPVGSIAESRDGVLAMTCGGVVYAYQLEDLSPRPEWRAHDHLITAMAFLGGGKRLLTTSLDETTRLWDVAQQRLIREWKLPKGAGGLAVSPDEQRFAVHCFEGIVQVYGLDAPEVELEIREGVNGEPARCCFSPDGKLLAVAGYTHTEDYPVRVVDSRTGELTYLLQSQQGFIRCLDWCGRTNRIAVGGYMGQIDVWDIGQGKLQYHQQVEGPVNHVRWAPNGKWLATCGEDYSVRIFDPAERTQHRIFQGHQHRVTQLAWSPVDPVLSSASHDGSVKQWSLEDRPAVTQLRVNSIDDEISYALDLRTELTWRPDGQRLAAALGDFHRSWNMDHQARETYPLAEAKAFCWIDGGRAAVGMDNQGVFSLTEHLSQPTKRHELEHYPHRGCLAATPAGDLVAVSANRLWLWDPAEPAPPRLVDPFPEDKPEAMAWNRAGNRLAVATANGNVVVYNRHGERLEELEISPGLRLYAVAWDPAGKFLAAAGDDAKIRIVAWESGEVRYQLYGHVFRVWGLDWSPDGKRLASASGDQSALIWDVRREAVTLALSHKSVVRAARWSPDGRQLATLSNDGRVYLWDATAGYARRQFR